MTEYSPLPPRGYICQRTELQLFVSLCRHTYVVVNGARKVRTMLSNRSKPGGVDPTKTR